MEPRPPQAQVRLFSSRALYRRVNASLELCPLWACEASVELGSTWLTARYTQCQTQLFQVVLLTPAGHPLKARVCLSSSARRSCWWRIASSRNALVEPVGPPPQPPTAPSEPRQLWWKDFVTAACKRHTRKYRGIPAIIRHVDGHSPIVAGLTAHVLTRTSRSYPAHLCQRPSPDTQPSDSVSRESQTLSMP